MAQATTTAAAGTGRWSRLLAIRLLVAFVQALALYGLATVAAEQPPVWPASSGETFGPILLVAIFVPFLVVHGLGEMRGRPLAIWTGIATLVIAGLSLHAATREVGREIWPWFPLWLALSMALFVAHVLVIDATAERRWVPSYARHFDTGWKLGVQVVLSVVFVGVFWGILWLGAGLFKLLGLSLFGDVISHPWFAFPATTLAMALSIHVTDVQPALIRGVRSLALTLFSWLLPLLAVILVGFLASLLVTSVDALWRTKFATVLLLIAAALVVFLINCCYQDGAAVVALPRLKRLAGTVGALVLVPLVGLAAWALGLRIGQYGWTVERILGVAVIAIAACYAIGYAAAALGWQRWLKGLEATNVVTAYVFLALVLALFSPLGDPSRLMVADQVARLRSGAVSAEQFDFAALKNDGARWGAAALAELGDATDVPSAADVNDKARKTLAEASRKSPAGSPITLPPAERIVVQPADRKLPAGFIDGPLADAQVTCAAMQDRNCIARYTTLRPGGPEVLVVFAQSGIYLFEQDAGGRWRNSASASGSVLSCAPLRRTVEGSGVAFEPHPWPDVMVGGRRFSLGGPTNWGCP